MSTFTGLASPRGEVAMTIGRSSNVQPIALAGSFGFYFEEGLMPMAAALHRLHQLEAQERLRYPKGRA